MLRPLDALPWALLAGVACLALVDTPSTTSLGVAALAGGLAALGGLGWAACLSLAGRLAPAARALGWAALLVPPYLAAVGLIEFFGPAGYVSRALGWATRPDLPTTVGWIYTNPLSYALTLAGAWLPVAGLAIDAAWRRIDPRALAAARLARGRVAVLGLHASTARGPALVGALAVGVLSLGEFASAQLLRLPVLSESIQTQAHDPGAAWISALPLLVASGLALGGCLWVSVRPLPRAGLATPVVRSAWTQAVAGLGSVAVLTPGLWLPVGFLASRLGSRPGSGSAWSAATSAVKEAWTFGSSDVGYSLAVGAFTATWVTGLALFVVDRLRNASTLKRALAVTPALLCAAAPAPLIGIAVLHLGSSCSPAVVLRDSAVAVSATWALRFAVWPLLVLGLSLRRLPLSPLHAADLVPRSAWVRWARIRIPMLLPALVLSWSLVYALSVGEYEATLLVSPPGQAYLAVTVVNEAHYGQGHVLVGFVVLQLAVLAVPALVGTIAWLGWRGVAQRR